MLLLLGAHNGVHAAEPAGVIGVLDGDPLARLGVSRKQFRTPAKPEHVRYLRKTSYLNDCRAVVVHTMDDSNALVLKAMDVIDRYELKATFFIGTQQGQIEQMWPRLRKAVADGHELGAHSRTHQCSWPDTPSSCAKAYSDSEVFGARDDILHKTSQPYVWAWCYPCGLCASDESVHRQLFRAGYLVARNYPDEPNDGHLVPNLQTYAADRYNAGYTQVAQKIGGIAKKGNTDVGQLDAKFDEVYRAGGIYSLMSHAQWLDFGPDGFYEKHLSYIGGRRDVWYVPMGPLYAFRTVLDRTEVQALEPMGATARYVVYNDLDPKIYGNSITLLFSAPPGTQVTLRGRALPRWNSRLTDRWDTQYFRQDGANLYVTVRPNTIVEFR